MKELQRENYPKANKYLRRATELSPKDPIFLTQYGIVLMEMHEFEQAMDVLRAAHELDAKDPDILFSLLKSMHIWACFGMRETMPNNI
ncbi:tetratricopeptide repeat protein [Planococcus halocryophilus]|uniref:tetratricopeptide repeat protein n=1 Tax=Planococcus halocryophilus TaxID=1215089 RepID=UPI00034A4B05|nr:tetratricopeptide repeat protein [Planococcus halocryophilus]